MRKKIITVVVLLVVAAAGVYSMTYYHDMKIDQMRANGVKELRAQVTMKDYGKKEKKKIRKILKADKKEILVATDQVTIQEIIEGVPEQIKDIPTIKQIRRAGQRALNEVVSMDKYRAEEQKEIRDILDDAQDEIDKCTEKGQINEILEDVKADIKDIKTDAQLTAEEEEAARLAELERQRAAAAAAAAAAKEKAAKKKSSGSKKNKNSGGRVGDDAKNFY